MSNKKIGIFIIALLVVFGTVKLFFHLTAQDVLVIRLSYAGSPEFNTGYIMEVKYFKSEVQARDYYSKLGVGNYNLWKKSIGSVKGVYDSLPNSSLIQGGDMSANTKHVLYSNFNIFSNKTPDQRVNDFIKENSLEKI